jgi:pimeloyl-ACP methyl ester carboxylesterase
MEKFTIANECVTLVCDTQKGDKTVVLLHGYLESLNVWDELTDLIKRDVRVITLDLPGHGVSEVVGEVHSMEFLADVVADVMRGQEVERATIVGHSMGGYVAMAMLERHPEMVEGIVMLHSTPYADSDEKKANREREIKLIKSGKKDTDISSAFAAVAAEYADGEILLRVRLCADSGSFLKPAYFIDYLAQKLGFLNGSPLEEDYTVLRTHLLTKELKDFR